jgi:hypothetical protein
MLARSDQVRRGSGFAKGKTHSFKWKIEKNKWYHSGKLDNGLAIDEV